MSSTLESRLSAASNRWSRNAVRASASSAATRCCRSMRSRSARRCSSISSSAARSSLSVAADLGVDGGG